MPPVLFPVKAPGGVSAGNTYAEEVSLVKMRFVEPAIEFLRLTDDVICTSTVTIIGGGENPTNIPGQPPPIP